jgi:carboxypeptidase T
MIPARAPDVQYAAELAAAARVAPACHPESMHRRRLAAALLAAVMIAYAVPPFALGAEPDFPRGYTGYHTHRELRAELEATAAAYPAIVRAFSIGTSYGNRQLWAAKVSDNVAVDESEPEVLYDGGHHADEHMSVEMTLRILRWLTRGYGHDPRITGIVDGRELWIVFSVNPDGAEFDIKGGRFHYWRKNRQPTPGTSFTGTDLNRNYGYRWGGGGRTSSNPQAITYRGPRPFSAPETQAMGDFLASRVVGGRQQIRAAITFHETGRLVMWPYGYTHTDVPGDMTRSDHAAFVALGHRMAGTNGYRPQQASDLYITSGTTRDYEYGVYRIFGYTFELSNRDYMDDSLIGSETGRNREAVLLLAERAWCPLSLLGPTVRRLRCGALDDDLEVTRGWRIDPFGSDTATSGTWQRANPAGTALAGPKQLDAPASGIRALVTGPARGRGARSFDLDGGRTSVLSPPIALAASAGQRLMFRYYLAHGPDSSSDDALRVSVVVGGASQQVFVERGAGNDDDAAWATATVSLDGWAGQTIRILITATDAGSMSLVEAGIDDVRVTRGAGG